MVTAEAEANPEWTQMQESGFSLSYPLFVPICLFVDSVD